MKRKKFLEDLQAKTEGELETLLASEKKELAELMLKAKAGQESNVRKAKQFKQRIARIMTILRTTSVREQTEAVTD